MNFHETIVVSAERKQLAPLRGFIEQQARKTTASVEEIQDLVLAVDEAATNIIVHGYRDMGGEIEVDVEHQPGRITVFLRDQAAPFDPTTVPEPDLCLPLEERPVGGLGVHIIRQSVDEFSYAIRAQGGNELKLVKYLAENGGQK
jgi:serine/threonine-protein kinase RsbW